MLLELDRLVTQFETRGGVLRAVNGVSLRLDRGEILGIVGESGSGKSVLGYSIIGLIDPPGRIASCSVRFDGRELVGMPKLSGEIRARLKRSRRDDRCGPEPATKISPREGCSASARSSPPKQAPEQLVLAVVEDCVTKEGSRRYTESIVLLEGWSVDTATT